MSHHPTTLGLLGLLSLSAGAPACAQFSASWSDGGVPAAPAPGYYQANVQALADGEGGVFLAWAEYTDYRSHTGWTGSDIRAQRLDANGAPLWSANGITVCAAPGDQQTPVLISDGSGGIVVAWMDARDGSGDIYAQRLTGSGTALWAANGVAVCAAPNVQQSPVIAPDGSGGAVVAWEDYRTSKTSGNADIYVQRVRADGTMAWTADGVGLATGATVEFWPRIAADGSGGAMVAWTDAVTNNQTAEIHARHVAADGVAGPAVGVGSAPNDQILNSVAPDGTGGYLLAWWDYRNSTTNADVYVQRLDASLAPLWGATGTALAAQPYDEYEPLLVPDGSGGATVLYHATGSGVDVRAARIDAAGTVQWTDQPVSTATGDQVYPVSAPDGRGGLLVAWEDNSQPATAPDVFMQHLSTGGTPFWAANGLPLAASVYYEQAPAIVPSGEAGGAIVAWEDWRDVSGGQVYAQRIRSATLPVVPGDADGDGVVTAADAVLLLKFAAGLQAASADALAAGDIAPAEAGGKTGDGRIGVDDALYVLRAVNGQAGQSSLRKRNSQ